MKKFFSLCLVAAANALFLWLVLGSGGAAFEPMYARMLLFVMLLVVSALALKLILPGQNKWWLLGAAGILNAAIYQVVGGENAGLLRYVSTYPLSLNWSEGSRYYYASLFLSPSIYGFSVPPSILHPSRYWMQAIPFLLPNTPLWLHRLWQVFLFDATTLAAGLLLAWRLRRLPGNPLPFSLFTLYAFLFLFQGPVYYHLLVMVILVLWFTNPRRPWLTLTVVLAASAWAGISRINWLPVPALLATAIYLLETPLSSRNTQHATRYFLPPTIWTLLGSLTGYLVQTAYKLGSGNPLAYFDSSFRSQLLWYRLWPNVTYPSGILASTLLVSLPLLGILLVHFLTRGRAYHWLRWLGLAAILLVLLFGGVLVSLKIGGGSNLHNLDAFLVLSLVIGAYLYFDRFAPDASPAAASMPTRWRGLGPLAGCLAVVIPIGFIVTMGGPLPHYDFARARQSIRSIQQMVDAAKGDVLFVRERQLLMFGDIQGVTLVPEYEVVFAMEMAMADNQPYQQALRRDLTTHRYALIISEPVPYQLLGPEHQFGEENDAWLLNVADWIGCTYEPALELPDAGLVVWQPRVENDCP